jgi:Co/Zn/Cd efflux system component
MRRTLFDIPGMDCPSEERIIRLALEPLEGVASLNFDLRGRRLAVDHSGDGGTILRALQPLGLGTVLRESGHVQEKASEADPAVAAKDEATTLKILLAINAIMFCAEFAVGWLAHSTGLVADSLDMFADAMVYGLSLYVVGRSATAQKRAAATSGWLQLMLAGLALSDVVRRVVVGSEPGATPMIGMAVAALVANVTCLALLFRHREGRIHMKASWIFSGTDVLANCGVILAGILVAVFERPWPDLVVGVLIVLIVIRGGIRIIRVAGATPAADPASRNLGA